MVSEPQSCIAQSLAHSWSLGSVSSRITAWQTRDEWKERERKTRNKQLSAEGERERWDHILRFISITNLIQKTVKAWHRHPYHKNIPEVNHIHISLASSMLGLLLICALRLNWYTFLLTSSTEVLFLRTKLQNSGFLLPDKQQNMQETLPARQHPTSSSGHPPTIRQSSCLGYRCLVLWWRRNADENRAVPLPSPASGCHCPCSLL